MIARLRAEGNDSMAIEAKLAGGGFPDTVAETLSAFANTPGGGDIVFGVDESAGFAVTGVYDAKQCQQAVASLARNGVRPPLQITTQLETVDGAAIVIAHVPEADAAVKPVTVRRTGLAYLRQYDGDYPISEQEEQAFIADRGQPVFDEAPVMKASLADLDARAIADYVSARRLSSPALERMETDEVLVRTGVVAEGHQTVAGVLALGVYPQPFFANLGIQASLAPPGGSRPQLRSLDSVSLTGPIPRMLTDAVAWVYRVTGHATVGDPVTGEVRDRATYPVLAVRELIANALIHRDLGPYALNQPITLQADQRRLLVANPGGLFGLRVDALGKTPSHLRNGRLAEICQYVTTNDQVRVVERLGTGIPTIREELARSHMAPPRFIDQGVRFTAIVQAASRGDSVAGDNRTAVLTAVGRHGPLTRQQIASRTGLSARQVTYALRHLGDAVTASAIDGKTYAYSSRASAAPEY